MSGIIADLEFRTPNATLPSISNGFVWLGVPAAYCATNPAKTTVDKWFFPLMYYACQADQQAGCPPINVSAFVLPDGVTPVMTQVEVDYVPNSGPVQAALVTLQSWWQNGTIVP